jgi:hypothetical protein
LAEVYIIHVRVGELLALAFGLRVLLIFVVAPHVREPAERYALKPREHITQSLVGTNPGSRSTPLLKPVRAISKTFRDGSMGKWQLLLSLEGLYHIKRGLEDIDADRLQRPNPGLQRCKVVFDAPTQLP